MTDFNDKEMLEQAAEWFFRRDGGRLSVEDEVAFRSWLAASDRHRAAYSEIAGTWQDLGAIQPTPAVLTPPPPARDFLRPIAAAFTFLCLLGLGTYVLDVPSRLFADGYTAVGEFQVLALPDGSTAEMNSGTAITIAYSSGERRIHLMKGEAVFTVTSDQHRPFIVESEGGEATALGTVYGVRNDDRGGVVTVVESHVAVSGKPAGASVELGPDERVRYEDGHLGAIEKVDAASETAWRRRKLIFVDQPLGEVVNELNRYHKGVIRIVDESISARRVSGVFETNDIVKVIDALEKSFGFNDTRLGSLVILIHR
ncbi:FecR family protein [Rhizobium laguerreae]|uniref:FecR family protein n=1 Tax=Rhizobium laguerreae TaxID=1076926 RepID=UPI001C916D28|nr:FecR family protein [Rhizobium laguerreae]MBY3075192.1 FecR family protein [Rhizobium laguerreae]